MPPAPRIPEPGLHPALPPELVWVEGQGRARLSAAERARAEGFPAEKRRRDWIRGRGAARSALELSAERAGLGPLPPLEIGSDRHGAPRIECPDPRFRFAISLSHGHEYAAAWALPPGEGLPGVDLERKKTRPPGTFRFYLDPEERAQVEALESEPGAAGYSLRDEAAIVCWSLKEAAFKALLPPRGTGLRDVSLRLEVPASAPRGGARIGYLGGLEERAQQAGVREVRAGWEHRGPLVVAWVWLDAPALPGVPEPLSP